MRVRVLVLALAILVVAAGSARAQLPGSVFPGLPPNPPQTLAEQAEPTSGAEHYVQVQMSSPVQSGYLVLYEPGSADPTNPANWSDVVVFASSQFPSCQAGDPAIYALLVSDSPNEVGMSNFDFAQLGLTIAAIQACGAFTVYRAEGTRADGLNVYSPDPNSVYNIYSDSEVITPTRPHSWGRVKTIYR